MNPIWRERIFASVAAILAVWLAANLAEGSIGWPLVAAVIALGAILIRVTSMPVDALTLGGLIFGYIVGNRGFAQLMPVAGLPLLPGEIGIVIAGGLLALHCALTRSLPWRRDTLNLLLLAWIVVGTARFAFDFPRYGFVAVRDYATIYYVSLFFIAQHVCREAASRKFLIHCFLAAGACLPFTFALFELFPAFFLGTLTVRGVPLIFFKGDLAPTFLAVSAILLFLLVPRAHRWWSRPLATAMVVWVFAGDNRASMLGLIGALVWIAASRLRSFAWMQAGVLAFGLLVFTGVALLGQNRWAEDKLASFTERLISVTDFTGRFTYRSAESSVKSDNNQFRWVWWRSVATETWHENPALGLGFGYDLARGFLQEYNPDMAEDFTARSPHSIFVSALGRLGLVGLALWTAIFVALLRRTWRIVRDPDSDDTSIALWAALWPIYISACLGVVLEGPMGAVVFWTLLGLAHAHQTATAAASAPSDSVTALPAPLPSPNTDAHSYSPVRMSGH